MLKEVLTGCDIDAGGTSMYRQGHARECLPWKKAENSMCVVSLVVMKGVVKQRWKNMFSGKSLHVVTVQLRL
jgi:hypothetical protein